MGISVIQISLKGWKWGLQAAWTCTSHLLQPRRWIFCYVQVLLRALLFLLLLFCLQFQRKSGKKKSNMNLHKIWKKNLKKRWNQIQILLIPITHSALTFPEETHSRHLSFTQIHLKQPRTRKYKILSIVSFSVMQHLFPRVDPCQFVLSKGC